MKLVSGLLPLCCFAAAAPALAQAQAMPADAPSSGESELPQQNVASQPAPAQASEPQKAQGSGTDIFSKNVVTVLLDARMVVANGEKSWVNRGLGKTAFQGNSSEGYKFYAVPVEGDLIWTPHFSNSLSASVSAAWQRDQEHAVDLLEAFLSYLPEQKGPVGFSARAGVMWPEISLEHTTGGAWTTVNTLTPSAINSWVGEEVKVLGLEATVRTSIGDNMLAFTGSVFGLDETAGTLLSFRGWALHSDKATVFGHFPLPPQNPFITQIQQNETRSLLAIDRRAGFYGRVEWRPPAPFGVALFYYDNRADPEAFTRAGQWGWRTRFLNLGINADLGPKTRLLAQGITGSTLMGFKTNGRRWVHTQFRSAYVLVTQTLSPKAAVTGRIEAFRTHELGSQMSPLDSEHGWSTTVALRYNLRDNLTGFAEAMNVRSRRGVRLNLGLDPFQPQTVFQLGLRLRI
ncbi:MAG TPA: hypothetical protein VJ846_00620 [Sphingomicrobium sp.]|nr:hypothetical protein [Sphingomicrobium sp.]